MRSFDAMSGSQPCPESFRMLARASRMRLDCEEIRIKTLEIHTDHKKWEDTPYISFSNCPRSFEDLANCRRTRKGRSVQHIVVTDPRIRIELGLPILHCGAEMAHYQVKAPYSKDYWQNHYLCLWEVTPAEIVGIWEWDDLRRSPNWYEDVIVPAVTQQRAHMERTIPVQRGVRQEDQRLFEIIHHFDDNIHWSDSDDSYKSEDGNDLDYEYESDDSYERVCEEYSSGQLMNMMEDFRID